jgi:hypothetical protein
MGSRSRWNCCSAACTGAGDSGVHQLRGRALPGFNRARMLGEAIGQWAKSLNKRAVLASGGLSHQPPVPELAKVDARMADRDGQRPSATRR